MYDPMAESELSKYSVLKFLIWVSYAAITVTLLYSVDYPFVDFSTSLSVCVSKMLACVYSFEMNLFYMSAEARSCYLVSCLIQCLSLNLELACSAGLPGQQCLGIVSYPPCQLQVFTVMLGIELRSPLRYDRHITDWIIFPTFLFIQRFLWLRVYPSQFLIFFSTLLFLDFG